MKVFRLRHLPDRDLLHGLSRLEAQDCNTTAELLAHLAEVDERKLFVPAGYSSLHAYCVSARGYSEDIAYKRIRVARAARRFPAILPALAEGRLNLSVVVLLARHLTRINANELLAAATNKTNRKSRS